MVRRLTPQQVSRLYGVAKSTVIGWCESGAMPAVNVASESAVRKRWRMSEDDLQVFDSRRGNKPAATQPATGRRTIERPTKDYFAGEVSR